MNTPAQNVLWRAAAASGAKFDNDVNLPPQPYAVPIPNELLREASSVGSLDVFYAIGEAWAHMVGHFLQPNPAVLDIGCGCGKLARFLYLNPSVRYVGVDIFQPAIEWCRRAFAPLAGERFRFEHFDGHSAVYNPAGTIKSSEYRLPCADGSIDTTVCASLFTHLLLPDLKHYLDEITRVSSPQGQAIISLHTEPAEGERISGDESRIDADPLYFAELAGEAGLTLRREIGLVYGQRVFLFGRAA